MNKRKNTTQEIREYLRIKKIPEMWNKNYSKWYVQINKDILVNLGGQGYMNEQYKRISEIEEYWGGVIDDIPFVVSLFWHDKEISDEHYIKYLLIDEIDIYSELVDEGWFLKRFRELILDYGIDLETCELDDCIIINKPEFKYI